MVEGNAKLIVDLGNSETRITTHFGRNSKGEIRKRTTVQDNRYGIMPENKVQLYLNSQVYTEDNSSIFTLNDQTYCNGDVCSDEFSTTAVRPTALEKKYESFVSKLTLINAFRIGYEHIAEMADCDLSSVDVDWDVVMLLPPEDADEGSTHLADMVRSITRIDFTMPKLSTEIRIHNVTILPEGYCAYAATLFESKTRLRKGYAYLADPNSYTLIIDIGGGTTDFMLAKGVNIIASSRFTKAIGGNNVSQRVRKLLRDEGISVSDATAKKGTVEGVIKSGAKTFDITEEIKKSKMDVSQQLVDAVKEFFEENMLPVQEINNLFVCGGGSVGSEKVHPISKYIVEFMERLSNNISLVKLPEIDGQSDPRLLNIQGASILSE